MYNAIGTKEHIFFIIKEEKSEKLSCYDKLLGLLPYLSIFSFIDKNVY